MTSGPKSSSRREQVETAAEKVLWLALLAVAAAAAYLVYAVFAGDRYVAGFNQFPQAEQFHILSRLRVACQLATYASWVALAALAVRSWHASEWGYAALLAGALCQLAIPQLLRFALVQQGGQAGPASELIVTTFRGIGTVALVVGAILAGRDLLDRLTARRLRARVVAARATSPPRVRNLPLDRQDRFLGKCWELPMCRPAIRRSCPVFIRGKQPCWRIGVGCMCSEEVLTMAARNRGEDLTQGQPSPGAWRPQHFTLESLASRLTPQQKRERCMNCTIYLHHQEQKYRAALPVTIAAVALLATAMLPLFHRGFVLLAHATDRIAGSFTLRSPNASALDPRLKDWTGHLAEAYVAEWILFFCVAVVVLSYALLALEYAITRRGW
jgi:hypothetical protein